MNLDGLPDYITAADLEPNGITAGDVPPLCPLATNYGPPDAPYWHLEGLGPRLGEIEKGVAQ